eukprot:756031_1
MHLMKQISWSKYPAYNLMGIPLQLTDSSIKEGAMVITNLLRDEFKITNNTRLKWNRNFNEGKSYFTTVVKIVSEKELLHPDEDCRPITLTFNGMPLGFHAYLKRKSKHKTDAPKAPRTNHKINNEHIKSAFDKALDEAKKEKEMDVDDGGQQGIDGGHEAAAN